MDPVTERLNADPLILSALREDIETEDESTNAILRGPAPGMADLIARRTVCSAASTSLPVCLSFSILQQ